MENAVSHSQYFVFVTLKVDIYSYGASKTIRKAFTYHNLYMYVGRLILHEPTSNIRESN